jgi:Flp pilus assembly protein TadG
LKQKIGFTRERGSTLVEFTIASTVFFIFIFGTLEFGRAVYQYNVIAHAGKAAVRWAAVRGNSSGQTPATTAQVDSVVQTQLYGVAAVDTVSWTPADKKPGGTVQVILRGSYGPRIPFFSSRTLTLRSVSQMIVVR